MIYILRVLISFPYFQYLIWFDFDFFLCFLRSVLYQAKIVSIGQSNNFLSIQIKFVLRLEQKPLKYDGTRNVKLSVFLFVFAWLIISSRTLCSIVPLMPGGKSFCKTEMASFCNERCNRDHAKISLVNL